MLGAVVVGLGAGTSTGWLLLDSSAGDPSSPGRADAAHACTLARGLAEEIGTGPAGDDVLGHTQYQLAAIGDLTAAAAYANHDYAPLDELGDDIARASHRLDLEALQAAVPDLADACDGLEL